MSSETDTGGTDAAALVVLVTGMSGAGKTSALKALEDLGFEAVDNIPLSLLGSLVALRHREPEAGAVPFSVPPPVPPLAIGVDIRTREFGIEKLLDELDALSARAQTELRVLFMDCDDDELRRRYATTRHRHPLGQDRPLTDGIASERSLISPLRGRADLVLDTTGRSPGDLKRMLQGHFGGGRGQVLHLFVTSFSYRQGLPREADLVFDVRFLVNPHYDPELRPLTGQDASVGAFIETDAGLQPFLGNLTALLQPLLPRYAEEGKSYLTIAIGCTGGRHRSVYVAERLAAWLNQGGYPVQLVHRELDR
ncbi:MAG: RNase adapter RapZ [Hyphomicrobiales bacterium]|nr:RNase adapter RapZ [Hyphomicrobiales bacterium]MCP5374154.1 RNase adapter RapZ [Hyphomicrobiales bacterium]